MLSLCDTIPVRVAERESNQLGTASRLRRLADETAFVRSDGDTFCLTPLFRLALARRMTTNEPGAVAPTHLRIAQAWLDEPISADSTSHAVHHLLEASEFERAVNVLQQRWGVLYSESRVHSLVELIERVPVRYWVDDAGCALLVGWANLLIERCTRALELMQSPPLRTPVGAPIRRLVWAQGVWWTTGPTEALQIIAEGRSLLDALAPGEPFPRMPGNDGVPAFRIVADGAEIRARFLLGGLDGAVDLLEDMGSRPSLLEPISVAGLHAVGALVRAFRGDRHEALTHLQAADSLVSQLGVADHYMMYPAHAGALGHVEASSYRSYRDHRRSPTRIDAKDHLVSRMGRSRSPSMSLWPRLWMPIPSGLRLRPTLVSGARTGLFAGAQASGRSISEDG